MHLPDRIEKSCKAGAMNRADHLPRYRSSLVIYVSLLPAEPSS